MHNFVSNDNGIILQFYFHTLNPCCINYHNIYVYTHRWYIIVDSLQDGVSTVASGAGQKILALADGLSSPAARDNLVLNITGSWYISLAGRGVGVQVMHGILQSRDNTTLNIQNPGLFLTSGANIVHTSIYKAKPVIILKLYKIKFNVLVMYSWKKIFTLQLCAQSFLYWLCTLNSEFFFNKQHCI